MSSLEHDAQVLEAAHRLQLCAAKSEASPLRRLHRRSLAPCPAQQEKLGLDSVDVCAAYVDAIRERPRREALAQLRTGSHWLAEETGRWQQPRVPHEQRICPYCRSGVEDVAHVLFACPLYAPLRVRFADLFSQEHTLQSFFAQPPGPVAHFAAVCRRAWVEALDSEVAS